MNEKKSWVLVTGGTRGIGRGIVECVAKAGFSVIFTYVRSTKEAQDIEEMARAEGLAISGYPCDGADAPSVSHLMDTLVTKYGPPLALVNNAGITADALLCNMSVNQWDKVIDVNLKSAFLFSKAVLPSMMEARNGVILHMSSVTAIKGNVGQSNYAATKAALLGMSRTLALEVARFNIRVNSILPGLVDTEMVGEIPENQRKSLERKIPLKRLCTVNEIGELVKFLISESASYMTGQTFGIDGGLSA